MKKILYLLASNKYSGAENVVSTIINSMDGEFETYYCSPMGPIKTTLEEKGINYIPIKKFTISEIKKVIQSIQPDIIHANDFKASCLASHFASSKIKIISHIHQNPNWLRTINIKTLLYKHCAKKMFKIIVVSKSVIDEYVFRKDIMNKTQVIYNYVNEKNVREQAKEKYSKRYDLCYFGRLSEEKNPLQFIEIVAGYKEKYDKKVTACMIGDGDLRELCQSKIKELKLERNIDLLGFQKNPFKIVNNCKCVIMPSKYEGFGLAAIESLILEKPVLNSGAGGLKEIFEKYPEYICDSTDDYIKKINVVLKEELKNIELEKYCNKKQWLNNLLRIYK